jgi:ABC-type antimicrobial peptide transport system permease subunit
MIRTGVECFEFQIFTFVVVMLIGLGAMLIYSLLLSNVEEKTYEYGMLRAQGMQQYTLIELLVVQVSKTSFIFLLIVPSFSSLLFLFSSHFLFLLSLLFHFSSFYFHLTFFSFHSFLQSLSFSIPAILIGLLLSFLLFIAVAYFIHIYSFTPMDLSFSGLSLGLAVGLGLLMPFIAIVSPIQRALSKTLRDALDIYHQVQSETEVQIMKLEQLGLSPWQLAGKS